MNLNYKLCKVDKGLVIIDSNAEIEPGILYDSMRNAVIDASGLTHFHSYKDLKNGHKIIASNFLKEFYQIHNSLKEILKLQNKEELKAEEIVHYDTLKSIFPNAVDDVLLAIKAVMITEPLSLSPSEAVKFSMWCMKNYSFNGSIPDKEYGRITYFKHVSTKQVITDRELWEEYSPEFFLSRIKNCDVELEMEHSSVVMGGLRFEGDDGLGPRRFESSIPKITDNSITITKILKLYNYDN